MVINRLFSHRLVGVGKVNHGIRIARAIRGIPISEGLKN